MAASRPDIIVAIDLGTTYTGVAWARPQRNQVLQSPIQVIHNWPGVSSKNEQKVHTCLVYNIPPSSGEGSGQQPTLSSWGGLCEDEDLLSSPGTKQKHEFFKVFLDAETLAQAHAEHLPQAPATIADAQRLVSDFLSQMYSHVKATVELHTGISHVGWAEMAVEFVFSVPTTWRTQAIINVFKSAIRDAGFGSEGRRHAATVELTESEAAAVGTIKSSTVAFRSGDIFLSIDAGGGTTDLALMQVVEAREPFPSLSQINQVDGIGIGSTLIDKAFLAMVEARLAPFPEVGEQLPPGWALQLSRSDKFKTMKHKFGESVYSSPTYKLPIEGAPFKLSHAGARIELGRLVLTWEEIQSLFDPHVEGILLKVQEQLDWMYAHNIDRPISYMILSGGLGSSKYVRDRLHHHIHTNPHPHAQRAQILQAPDPQLVVVKGLLLDRLQSLDSGTGAAVIVSRVARSSYGYVYKVKYNPDIHGEETVKRDPYDGELYAMGQIDWLIRKGDPVGTNDAITSTFTKKVESGDSNRSWDSVIMISDLDRDHLPKSVNEPGAKQLCTVKSNLAGVENSEMTMKRKAKRFMLKGKKFFLCTFEVRAIVAPADIRFELWFNGQRFSKNHDPIQITWDNDGAAVGGGGGRGAGAGAGGGAGGGGGRSSMGGRPPPVGAAAGMMNGSNGHGSNGNGNGIGNGVNPYATANGRTH